MKHSRPYSSIVNIIRFTSLGLLFSNYIHAANYHLLQVAWTDFDIKFFIIILLTLLCSSALVFIFRTKKLKDKLLDLKKDNEIVLNNIQSSINYLTPDFTVKWHNEVPFFCQWKNGEKYSCLSSGRLTDYCTVCPVIKASEYQKECEITKEYKKEYVRVSANPVYDDQKDLTGIVVKSEVITNQKQQENELREAKEAAEDAEKLKSAFFMNMSHEIRTPLTAIVGFSELLASADDPQEKAEYVSIIKSNNDALLNLFDEILIGTQIEAGKLDFQITDVNINSLLSEIEHSSRFKINKDIKIDFVEKGSVCVIKTDQNRLKYVLTNLIDNAIKFTEKGSIQFGYQLNKKNIYFYVSDTGPGISKNDSEKIFRQFVKVNSFSQGMGLGLSVCSMLVERLGGKIGIESEEGKGSTFWFTLPTDSVVHEGSLQLS